MKKILLLLFVTALFVGCTEPTLENSIENPEQFTTMKHQGMDKDTVTVIYDEENLTLYVYDDESNVIIERYLLYNDNSLIGISTIGSLIVILLMFLLGGVGMGLFINNEK